jgi:acetyl-CoA carboxylase biotin carboxyl carrier protein
MQMDYKELKEFIKSVAKSGVSEVEIKTEEMKVVIKVYPEGSRPTHTETIIQQIPYHSPLTTGTILQQPMQNIQTQFQEPVSPIQKEEKASSESNFLTIKSPMVGTFYRKPSPDKASFVNVGDSVNENTVVCIIEAMKLFNEIEAEVTGKIVKILVDDSSPVEFEQPLFLVEPGK